MEIFKALDVEQLLTATGFIVFLIYQNTQLTKRNTALEKERAALVDKYIEVSNKSSADLLEATRMFDRLIQAKNS